MTKDIHTIYNKELEKIIKDSNTISVFLVGSSKNVDFKSKNPNINDIDVFVFVNQGEDQVRIIKEIDNIQFDINYFSRNGLKKLMDSKEYFFLKEMKEAIIIYDKHKTASNIVTLCKRKFLEGPNILSIDEKLFLKTEIESKLSKLENKDKYETFEYDFICKALLKEMIITYFKVHDKWIPKDKKLLKTLKEEEPKLYSLLEDYYNESNHKALIKIYNYVFESIYSSKIIKLTY